MKNINVPFGGFYGSLHEDLIDNMLDNYFTNEDGITVDYQSLYDINYKVIFNAYIADYILNFGEFLKDEFNLDIKFHKLTLMSPTYYNYSTDEINCDISNKNAANLISLFKKDDDFLEWLKTATKSGSGYISFYSFEEALSNKDEILISYVMKYICNETFTNDEYLNYYDRNYGYELLYSLNFYKEVILWK